MQKMKNTKPANIISHLFVPNNQRGLVMNLIYFIILLFLAHRVNSRAIGNPILTVNRYFQTGFQKVIAPSLADSSYNTSFECTTTMTNPLFPIAKVYYSTAEAQANIYDFRFPDGNNTLNFIWYQILFVNASQTSMITAIKGYFQQPYFISLSFCYLMILGNNTFMGKYIVIEQFQYSPSVSSKTISYPTKYRSGDSIAQAYMINSIIKFYNYFALQFYGGYYQLKFAMDGNSASGTVTITPSLSNFVLWYRQYYVKFVIILICQTALQKDYPNYVFDAGIRYIHLSGYNHDGFAYISTSNNIKQALNNGFFGISAYIFYNSRQPSFSFNLRNDYKQYFQIMFNGNRINQNPFFFGPGPRPIPPQDFYLAYSWIIFPYYQCDSNNFIANYTLNECYDGCLDGEYFNATDAICKACHYLCQTCNNYDECLTCYSPNHRILQKHKCVPMEGYYQSNITTAFLCSNSCKTCDNLPTKCTSCQLYNQTLVNYTCKPCSVICNHCKQCYKGGCIACVGGYLLINATFCKLPCELGCYRCDDANISICKQCNNKLVLFQNKCIVGSVCGDGFLNKTFEECDDGNSNSHDGCSKDCKVEKDYNCHQYTDHMGVVSTIYCAYNRTLYLKLLSLEKIQYVNELRLTVSVSGYNEKFWMSAASLHPFIRIKEASYRNLRYKFINKAEYNKNSVKLSPTINSKYPSNSLMEITFQYLKTLHGSTVSLVFDFSNSSDYVLKEIPLSKMDFAVLPDNNQYAGLYSQSVYQKSRFLAGYFSFLAIAYFGLLLLSFLFGGAIITSEMIIVPQIAFIEMLTLPFISPIEQALSNLRFSFNGIDTEALLSIRSFDDVLANPKLKGAHLYSQFICNFNVGVLLILLPIVIGLIALLISRIVTDEEKSKRYREVSYSFLGSLVFSGLMFGGVAMGFGLLLEIQFGMQQTSSLMGLISLAAVGCLTPLFIIYGILRVCKDELFVEHSNILVQNSKVAKLFQLMYFYRPFLIGVTVVLLNNFAYVNMIILSLPIFLFVFTLKEQVFRRGADKYRTQLNLLCLMFIQIPFIYENMKPGEEYSDENDKKLMLPFFIGIVLSINFVINLGYFFYFLYKKIHNCWATKKNYTDKVKIQQITPQILLAKHAYRKGFIETDEQNEQTQQNPLSKINMRKQNPTGKQKMFYGLLTKSIEQNKIKIKDINSIDQI